MAKEKHWRQHRGSKRERKGEERERGVSKTWSPVQATKRRPCLADPVPFPPNWQRQRRNEVVPEGWPKYFTDCVQTSIQSWSSPCALTSQLTSQLTATAVRIFGDCTRCKVSSWGKGAVKSKKKRKKADEKEWPLIKAHREREGKRRREIKKRRRWWGHSITLNYTVLSFCYWLKSIIEMCEEFKEKKKQNERDRWVFLARLIGHFVQRLSLSHSYCNQSISWV